MSPITIPGNIAIYVHLEEGAVFYYKEDTFNSDKPHYFIVMNPAPKNDDIIVMVNATTNVLGKENYVKRRNIPIETIVKITKDDCDIFPADNTAFNCNDLTPKYKSYLIDKYNNDGLVFKGKIEQALINQLRKGIKLSTMISTEEKRFLGIN